MSYTVYMKAPSNSDNIAFAHNQPWKVLTPHEFEASSVDKKLTEQFTRLKLQDTIPYCHLASKEHMRYSIGLAEPGMYLRTSAFCKSIQTATGEELVDEVKLRHYVKPSQITIPDSSWLKFSVQNGRLFLTDMSDSITFNQSPSSASKQADNSTLFNESFDKQ